MEISGYDDFARLMERFAQDADYLQQSGRAAGDYVKGKAGAAAKILAATKL